MMSFDHCCFDHLLLLQSPASTSITCCCFNHLLLLQSPAAPITVAAALILRTMCQLQADQLLYSVCWFALNIQLAFIYAEIEIQPHSWRYVCVGAEGGV